VRLKASELAAYREQLWEKQGRRCALSGRPLALKDAVTDHCHKSGVIRGVLDRGANSLLGKVENHQRLARLTNLSDLDGVLKNVARYIAAGRALEANPDAPLYPTHRTPDERRERANAKRRKARATKKETAA
jgi:hypothetical protein